MERRNGGLYVIYIYICCRVRFLAKKCGLYFESRLLPAELIMFGPSIESTPKRARFAGDVFNSALARFLTLLAISNFE